MNDSERDDDGRPELSVVVLCFQAGETARFFVGELERELERWAPDHELVLVANCWPERNDPTPGIAAEMARANPRVRVVSAPKRGGMGEDLRAGLAAARGRAIAFIDGDRQMSSEDVVRVWLHLKEHQLDLCGTWRVRRMDGAGRRIVSGIYNLLFRILFPGLDMSDVNAKPKVLTREALERMELSSDDWFIDAEIVIAARRLKLRMGEVPTIFLKNESRRSFVRWTANLEFLKNLLVARAREFFW